MSHTDNIIKSASRFKSKNILGVFCGLAFSMVLIACKPASEPAPVKALIDTNIVELTPQLQQQIKVEAVSQVNMREVLRIPGRVEVDEQRIARIGASVTGRITDIDAVLGQNVKQGQTLATLNSTELAQNQLAYIKASQQIGLQSKALDRARILFDSDVISLAEVQRREAELSAAKADSSAADDQLQVLGMSKAAIEQLARTSKIRSLSSVTARLAGTVISRKVNLGQVVQPAEELFTVADLSHVWLVANVPEQQISLVKQGELVEVEIPALNNRSFMGKLIYVANVVDEQTRTVAIRSDIENADRSIKPEMLVSMLVQSTPILKTAVNAQSIVRENDKNYVFVKISANQFRLREVVLGAEYQGMIAVVSGVGVGDAVVTEGAFHVNNERKRKEME